MVKVTVVLGRATFDDAVRLRPVHDALVDVASAMEPRARSIAEAMGAVAFAESLHVESGTRPGTKSPSGFHRPFARVIADSEDAADREYGNENVDRAAILRRATGGA